MNKQKIAILSGVSGQDGSILAQQLLEKGYKVYGILRRMAHRNLDFIKEMGLQDVELVEADLGDMHSLYKIIASIKADEFYNLAAMSHVGTSFSQPEYTGDIDGLGVLRILENIRLHSSKTKFYQASTSELYGSAKEVPQNENTPFMPQSPYAIAKLYAHHMCRIYREGYGVFASCGILMNHESERRGKEFVTRKITDWIGRYVNGLTDEPLKLGALDTKRDWGYAPCYTKAMYLMLQQNKPDDFVIATGETHSIREFWNNACSIAGININRGYVIDQPLTELHYEARTGKVIMEIDPQLYRPAEVPLLLGDYSKAKRILGWEPQVKFNELVRIMVEHDIKVYSEDKHYVST